MTHLIWKTSRRVAQFNLHQVPGDRKLHLDVVVGGLFIAMLDGVVRNLRKRQLKRIIILIGDAQMCQDAGERSPQQSHLIQAAGNG
jgi:hypothetical protein